MNISQRQLKIFVALSQSLSFSRCAAQLNVTPPTLSKLLRELEVTLGVVLFERTTRSVRLTAEGALLVPIASRMIDAYDIGLEELRDFISGRADSLAAAAVPSVAALLTPACLLQLRKQFSTANIAFCDVSSEQALEMLRARRVNVAFTEFLPELANDTALEVGELISDDRFVLLAAKNSHRNFDDAVWSEEYLGHLPIITLARGSSSRMALELSFLGCESFRPAFELRYLVTIKSFVEADMGIAVLPKLTARLILDDKLQVIELKNAPKRSLCFVVRKGEKQAAIQRQFVNQMRQQAKLMLR